MKLLWTRFGTLTLLMAPPEAGAGGGAAAGDGGAGDGGDAGDQGDGGDAGDGGAGDGDEGLHTRGDAGDGDEDPDDDGLAPEVANDPKRLRTRLRRTQRQLKPFRDLEGTLRDRATGRLLTPQEVTRRMQLAEDQEELNSFFAEHPDVLQQVLERKRGGGRAAQAEEFQDPFADLTKLPFDATDESGRFFVDQFRTQAKENFELRQMLKRIEQGLTGVQQTTQRERLGRVEQQWRDTTLSAAKEAGLAGEDLQDFVNGVYRDFQLFGATKKLDRANVQEVITRNLRPFRRAAAGRTRGQAATQQQQARTNGGKPQPHRQGAPTTAQARTTGKETLKDSRRSFFERAGQPAPAR